MAWLYLVLTIAAGGFFYWLRGSCRSLYGFLEIVVALVIMGMAVFSDGSACGNCLLISGPLLSQVVLTKSIGIIGGIYGFVRGLDNFVTGLRS